MNDRDEPAQDLTDRIQVLPALQLLLVVLSGLHLLLGLAAFLFAGQSAPVWSLTLFLITLAVVYGLQRLVRRQQTTLAAHGGSIFLLILINSYLLLDNPPAPGLAFLALGAVATVAIVHSLAASNYYALAALIVEPLALYYVGAPVLTYLAITLAGLVFIWFLLVQMQAWQRQAQRHAAELQSTIAGLEDQIERQTQIMQQREDDVEVLITIGQLLTTLDAQEVYRRALLAVADHIRVSRCMLTYWEPDSDYLSIHADLDCRVPDEQERFQIGGATINLANWPGTLRLLQSGDPLLRNAYAADIEPAMRDFLRHDNLHYALELPLMTEPRAIGTLILMRESAQGNFDGNEVRLARAVSFLIATAISNAIGATDARARVAQLNTFNRLSQVLSQTNDLRDMFVDARREILPLFEATGISILLVNQDSRTMTWAYGFEYGLEVDLSKVGTLSIDTGFSGHVARTGKPLLINQKAREQQAEFGSFSVGASANAWLGVPLIVANKTIGVLAIENADDPNALEEKDITLLSTIAGSLAISINNQLQLEQIQQALATQSSQSLMLRTAADVSAVAGRLLDMDELSQQVVNLVQTRFSLYYVGLYLVDDNGQKARLEAAHRDDETGPLSIQPTIPVDNSSLVGRAIATGRIHFVQASREREFRGLTPGLPETGSELALPLRSRQGILGALDVHDRADNAFSDETISILQTLADRLGGAIENARLFATVQASYIRLNNLFQASRQITGAADSTAVYRTLVDFARAASPIDWTAVVKPDPDRPDALIIAHAWSRDEPTLAEGQTYARAAFPIGDMTFTTRNRLYDLAAGDDAPADIVDYCRQNNLSALNLIPFYRTGQWLGTWILARVDKPALSEDAWQPFITLAGQANTVLANQALLSETVALYGASRSLNQAITREDALDIAISAVQRQTGAAGCRIVLYDERRGIGKIVAQAPEMPDNENLIWPMGGDPIYRQLQSSGRALHLHDDGSDSDAIQSYLRPFQTHASLIVPAFSQNELIGFMALDVKPGEQEFSEGDINFTQTLVDQLTIQIENLALFDEALARAQEMITLNQIGTLVTGTLDVNELAEMVYEQTTRLVQSDIFVLATADLESRTYETLIYAADGQKQSMPVRRLSRQDPIYRFLEQQTPRLSNDDPSLFLATMAELSFEGETIIPQAAIWLPLVQEERTVGLIGVQSWERFAFDENHLQAVRTISNQTSLGLANIRLFAEIQNANEQLRELDRLKTQFLTNMSHELRTPLNAIIGFSRIMLKGITGPITDEQEHDLNAIYNSGRHLLNLINDILDVARIEAGKMVLTLEEVSLYEASEQVLSTVRGLVQEKPVEIIADLEPDLPPVEADPVRLRQILLNLLSNAAKFTEKGYIRLEIRHQGDDHVYIAVHDTGVGIDPRDFNKIFEAFEQTAQSAELSKEGTGLGLPITKSLTEMHDGIIWVESEIGKGTTFHITLPIHQGEAVITKDV